MQRRCGGGGYGGYIIQWLSLGKTSQTDLITDLLYRQPQSRPYFFYIYTKVSEQIYFLPFNANFFICFPLVEIFDILSAEMDSMRWSRCQLELLWGNRRRGRTSRRRFVCAPRVIEWLEMSTKTKHLLKWICLI